MVSEHQFDGHRQSFDRVRENRVILIGTPVNQVAAEHDEVSVVVFLVDAVYGGVQPAFRRHAVKPASAADKVDVRDLDELEFAHANPLATDWMNPECIWVPYAHPPRYSKGLNEPASRDWSKYLA